ncbi:hypothetical protein ACFQX7_11415 [Luedemannella flava]
MGSDWRGIKLVSEIGPLHPRSEHYLDGTINSLRVPGGDYHGRHELPTPEHRADLIRSVTPELMERAAEGLGDVRVERLDTRRAGVLYRIERGGEAFTVRVETQWLRVDAAAETTLNHDKGGPNHRGEYVVQISDQLGLVHVERAMAHELGEIVADRARYAAGEPAYQPDVLRAGGVPDGARLSPHDAGRVQELRVLGRDLPASPTPHDRVVRESMALVDHLGLRAGEPGAEARRQLVLEGLSPAHRAQVERLLEVAGRDPASMTPAERAELTSIREQGRGRPTGHGGAGRAAGTGDRAAHHRQRAPRRPRRAGPRRGRGHRRAGPAQRPDPGGPARPRGRPSPGST